MPTPFQGWLREMMLSKIDIIQGIDGLQHKGDLIFIPTLALHYKNVNIALIIYWIYENICIIGHFQNNDNHKNKWCFLASGDFKEKFWWLSRHRIFKYINYLISINNLIFEPYDGCDTLRAYRRYGFFEGSFSMGSGAFWANQSYDMTDSSK